MIDVGNEPCCADNREADAEGNSQARPGIRRHGLEKSADVERLTAPGEEHIWILISPDTNAAPTGLDEENIHAPTTVRNDPMPPSPYLIIVATVDGSSSESAATNREK